jgi:hypothetical protein
VGTVKAVVFVERFLCEPIEGKRRNRAFQVGSSHTPLTLGAAPAAKVVTFDPDQAFIHTSTFTYGCWDRNRAANGWTVENKIERKVNSCPLPQLISHESCDRKSD